MDKFKEIRPIVLGVLIKNNKILVGEKYDNVKGEYFYRCLGGGIEFLETSYDALKREYLEELKVDVEVNDLIDIVENIFELNGKKAHEIIFIYKVSMENVHYKDEYEIDDGAGKFYAKWIDINEFIHDNKTLYPKALIKYLTSIAI
jgi:ADP-ribose pyrophosphatase YjhB (NUDIX family)